MIPYLVLAELQNSTLAAISRFSDRVIYRAYEAVPRVWDISALADQSIAGVIMWVPGSLVFLPAGALADRDRDRSASTWQGRAARHPDWPPRPYAGTRK